MQANDWKDILAKLDVPPAPDDPVAEPEAEAGQTAVTDTLRVLIDKKGRKGRPCVIIEGFTCPDELVENVASLLRKRLGVGGSSRGGEILVQGTNVLKVKEILLEMGYKVK